MGDGGVPRARYHPDRPRGESGEARDERSRAGVDEQRAQFLAVVSHEMRTPLTSIISFSELGDFVDEPVRTYSSGMYARLAFSVATHVDPDILIVDEILAVGDEHFSKKSLAKMMEFKAAGRSSSPAPR